MPSLVTDNVKVRMLRWATSLKRSNKQAGNRNNKEAVKALDEKVTYFIRIRDVVEQG